MGSQRQMALEARGRTRRVSTRLEGSFIVINEDLIVIDLQPLLMHLSRYKISVHLSGEILLNHAESREETER